MRLSFEIVPPLTGIRIDELLATVGELMEFAPSAINVTSHRDEYEFVQKPDGSFERRLTKSRISPTDVCEAILGRYDVNMVPHLICGGNTAADIDSLLESFRGLGVSEVMALRGDSVAGERRFSPTPGGYAHADELVAAVRRAGGFMLQLMPDATDEIAEKLEDIVLSLPPITAMLDEDETPEEILEDILHPFGYEELEKKPVRFRCDCTREKIALALAGLGKYDLLDLMVSQKEVEVRCDYCNTAYTFDREELKTLYRKFHRAGKNECKDSNKTEENEDGKD